MGKVIELPIERMSFNSADEAMNAAMTTGQACMWWQDEHGKYHVKRTKAELSKDEDGKIKVHVEDDDLGNMIIDAINKGDYDESG